MEIAYIKSLKEPSVRMSSILEEMGVRYNPVRLANALKGRQLEVSARAFRITYTLGRYIIGLAKVSSYVPQIVTMPSACSFKTVNPAVASGLGYPWRFVICVLNYLASCEPYREPPV